MKKIFNQVFFLFYQFFDTLEKAHSAFKEI